jgi:hypothetical protein
MRAPQEFKKDFIHKNPVDLRKSTNGLSEIVQFSEMRNLMESPLFVFSGRRRNVMKVSYFDKR